jgi:prevent-host-death family protein
METVSHRDLRNRSGAVLRAVAAGESFIITNDGTPVARLIPVSEPASDLPCSRPRRAHAGFLGLTRYAIDTASASTLDDLRGNR